MGKIEYEITVVVPVYNVEEYVKQCLESLLNQTMPIKIVVVDDGATDNSPIIIKAIAESHPDSIEIITQKNAGLSAARNAGLARSKTPYIAFMDSDDWVSPDYYESLYDAIVLAGADIACADITFTYPEKLELKPANTLPVPTDVLIQGNAGYVNSMIDVFPMIQNKLWNRTFLEENEMFFLDGKLYEDLDFFYRIYPFANKITFTNKGIFYYRQRAGSIVKSGNPRIYEITDIFSNIFEWYKEKNIFTTYQMELEYLLTRNCLVASTKRLSYSQDYRFINEYFLRLYDYVDDNVKKWKQNPYIKSLTIRHIYIKSINRLTIPFHSMTLVFIGKFLNRKDEY